jgi:hypothetical protein
MERKCCLVVLPCLVFFCLCLCRTAGVFEGGMDGKGGWWWMVGPHPPRRTPHTEKKKKKIPHPSSPSARSTRATHAAHPRLHQPRGCGPPRRAPERGRGPPLRRRQGERESGNSALSCAREARRDASGARCFGFRVPPPRTRRVALVRRPGMGGGRSALSTRRVGRRAEGLAPGVPAPKSAAPFSLRERGVCLREESCARRPGPAVACQDARPGRSQACALPNARGGSGGRRGRWRPSPLCSLRRRGEIRGRPHPSPSLSPPLLQNNRPRAATSWSAPRTPTP